MITNYDSILAEMQSKYTELSGTSPDDASDAGIKLKVLAAQVFSLYNKSLWIKNQAFPQTASGEYLDMHAETRGITRKAAKYSSGSLRFSKATPASFDINIPTGTICADTSNNKRYETISDAVLVAGSLYVDIPAKSSESSSASNTAAGTITLMITPPQGITSVTNPNSFSGGTDAESDEALRERLLKSFRTISNSTNSAFYYNHAMSFDEVISASVIPKARGIGTIDVVIETADISPSAEVISKIQQSFDKIKEINVDVLVKAPVPVGVDINMSLKSTDLFTFETACENIKARLREFFSTFTVSKSMFLAELYSYLLGTEGVYTFSISAPSSDVYPEKGEIIVLDSINVTEIN